MNDNAETAPEPVEAAQPETDWKAKAREWEKRAKENSKAAQRLAEIEDAQKSEAEKASERIAQLEAEAAQARTDALRYRVGVTQGLPPEFINRLQGTTEEELVADAASLAELVKPAGSPLKTSPTPTLVSGAVQDAEPETPDAAFRSFLSQSIG